MFPIRSLWDLTVAIETKVLVRSGPTPYAAHSPPNSRWNLNTIGWLVSEIFMFESVQWSKQYSYIKTPRTVVSVNGDRVWPKIKLIESYMAALVTCKN